eukprot:TRINITY_DN4441_c0_g1_i2.p1 TRINITY_DN4441_c0_g1~~TRINITY_DN4441_c0_g1_i2.p1  ORF type:complete len:543 (-),score=122.19 TRINITY_DN4441_c0_g1_i2:115-1743(-)
MQSSRDTISRGSRGSSVDSPSPRTSSRIRPSPPTLSSSSKQNGRKRSISTSGTVSSFRFGRTSTSPLSSALTEPKVERARSYGKRPQVPTRRSKSHELGKFFRESRERMLAEKRKAQQAESEPQSPIDLASTLLNQPTGSVGQSGNLIRGEFEQYLDMRKRKQRGQHYSDEETEPADQHDQDTSDTSDNYDATPVRISNSPELRGNGIDHSMEFEVHTASSSPMVAHSSDSAGSTSDQSDDGQVLKISDSLSLSTDDMHTMLRKGSQDVTALESRHQSDHHANQSSGEDQVLMGADTYGESDSFASDSEEEDEPLNEQTGKDNDNGEDATLMPMVSRRDPERDVGHREDEVLMQMSVSSVDSEEMFAPQPSNNEPRSVNMMTQLADLEVARVSNQNMRDSVMQSIQLTPRTRGMRRYSPPLLTTNSSKDGGNGNRAMVSSSRKIPNNSAARSPRRTANGLSITAASPQGASIQILNSSPSLGTPSSHGAPHSAQILSTEPSDQEQTPNSTNTSDTKEELELMFDPVLNCYFDAETGIYYKLK